jgi:zinc transporter 2
MSYQQVDHHHDDDDDHGHGPRRDGHSSDGSDGSDHHDDDHDESSKMLWRGLWLCLGFMAVELVAGVVASSLAVITDALHMLTDALAFGLLIYTASVAKMPSTTRYTYGFKRAEVLGAVLSTLLIWMLTAMLVYEAGWRMAAYREGSMEDVDGRVMFGVAVLGVAFNVLMERLLGGGEHGHGHSHGGHSHGHSTHTSAVAPPSVELAPLHGHSHHSSSDEEEGRHGHGHDHDHDHDHDHHDHEHSPKYGSTADAHPTSASPPQQQQARSAGIDAAYLHVLGDLIQNIGVAIAGLLIWWNPAWKIADPVCTWLFAVIVMVTTFSNLWSNLSVLLEGVPEGVDVKVIRAQILAVDAITDVHDLHVWSVGSQSSAPLLTAHVHAKPEHWTKALVAAHAVCTQHGVGHATIQVAPHGAECPSGICCDEHIDGGHNDDGHNDGHHGHHHGHGHGHGH